MVARFFKSRQLVAWAESLFLLKEGSYGAPAMEVASYLNSWLALQPPSTRDIVQMNVFVEAAYDELDVEYRRLRESALERLFFDRGLHSIMPGRAI